MDKRTFLSPPHLGSDELRFFLEAFESNYIAPVGPQIDLFEKEFAKTVGIEGSAAVSSGTAALHLVLRYAGVGEGDEVLCSTFTFVASANAILYLGAKPVFIDSDEETWNMDPDLLAEELEKRAKQKRLPNALVLVHLYGQAADIDPIWELCQKYNVFLVEDAAEALGALYKDRVPGTVGHAGIYSFNGNKIITTSGGGMVVSSDQELIEKVKFWATQARDEAVHYEHSEMGYNYRMSNILAAIGRGQLRVLDERVEKKRSIFQEYEKRLGDLPGVSFMPEPEWSRSSRWLTCMLIDPEEAKIDRDKVIAALEEENIESRPTWKPMHMQPLFRGCEVVGGVVAEQLFRDGICLPSGTAMSQEDMDRVVGIIRGCWK